jgi:hypothetical protein
MSDNRFLPIGICQNTVSASFTRPADTTSYASGDLVANSTTAGSVVPVQLQNAGRTGADRLGGRILSARILKSTATQTAASFRVHFFSVLPSFTNGDNGAFAIADAALPGYLGAIDVDLATSGVLVQASAARVIGRGYPVGGANNLGSDGIPFQLTDQSNPALYAVLEARGAYAPGNAEVFTLLVDVQQE